MENTHPNLPLLNFNYSVISPKIHYPIKTIIYHLNLDKWPLNGIILRIGNL